MNVKCNNNHKIVKKKYYFWNEKSKQKRSFTLSPFKVQEVFDIVTKVWGFCVCACVPKRSTCLNCKANIQDAELQSVKESIKSFPGNIAEPMHIHVNLKVIFSLKEKNNQIIGLVSSFIRGFQSMKDTTTCGWISFSFCL